MIEIEICLFNSLAKYGPGLASWRMQMPADAAASDVVRHLGLPRKEIYAAWRNGQNIMTTFGGEVEAVPLSHGDRLALSGPVPFSRGYGAPVC